MHFVSQFFERKIHRIVAMDHDDNSFSASAIDLASFEIMTEPLIPMQSANPVTPSIPSISNNIIHSSTETTTKEHDNLSDHKQARDNVACSNANFNLSIADSSDFMDSAEKDDATVQHALVTPDCIEDKWIDLAHEEIMCRSSKLSCQKIKSHLNLSGLST